MVSFCCRESANSYRRGGTFDEFIPFPIYLLRYLVSERTSEMSAINDAMLSCNIKGKENWNSSTTPSSFSFALVCDYHDNYLSHISPPQRINCTLVIFFWQESERGKHVTAPCLKSHAKYQCQTCCDLKVWGRFQFQSHLVLFDFVLGQVLSLAFPPQLLQVCLGALQEVRLHLVLGLVALKGGLQEMFDKGGTDEQMALFIIQMFLRCK